MSEQVKYFNGLLINGNFLDYKIPTSLDTPPIDTNVIETADPEGPFGAKECGEGAIHRASSPPLVRAGREPGAFLDGEAGIQHALLVECLADDLKTQRQALCVKSARNRHGGKPRQRGRHGEDVVEIHRHRIVRLFA